MPYDDTGDELVDHYHTHGFGGSVGFGRTPALLVIDMQIGYTDPSYPLGSDQSHAIPVMAKLIDAARRSRVPIFYATTLFEPEDTELVFLKKIPTIGGFRSGSRSIEIHPALAPRESDTVIRKKFPSSFAGTDLDERLRSAGIDTLILVGCSTSGCIRAAAQDGVSLDYHVIVPRDAVCDRSSAAHEANLIDIDAKFADVVSADDVQQRLAEYSTAA